MSDTTDVVFDSRICVVQFSPQPDALQHTHQTIDAEPSGLDDESVKANALDLLASIEVAVTEGRLALQQRRHRATGARGLVIVETWQPNPFENLKNSIVVGELLSEWPHELDDRAKDGFDYLDYRARRHELSVVMHAGEPGGSRVAFISTVENQENNLSLGYLARLFLTEREISQWTDGAST